MVVAGKDKRNIKMKKLVVVTMAVAGHPGACAVLLLCSQGCMAAEEPEAAVRTEPMRVTLTFERHLDDIAALEREGKIVVTDPK